MEKSLYVYTFNPEIYPRMLWIAIGTENPDPERFKNLQDFDDSSNAQIDHAFDSQEGKGGFLIRFEALNAMAARVITHESIHAAFEIFRFIGATADAYNQEPFCYLAGWIAECCEKVYLAEKRKLDDNGEV